MTIKSMGRTTSDDFKRTPPKVGLDRATRVSVCSRQGNPFTASAIWSPFNVGHLDRLPPCLYRPKAADDHQPPRLSCKNRLGCQHPHPGAL